MQKQSYIHKNNLTNYVDLQNYAKIILYTQK